MATSSPQPGQRPCIRPSGSTAHPIDAYPRPHNAQGAGANGEVPRRYTSRFRRDHRPTGLVGMQTTRANGTPQRCWLKAGLIEGMSRPIVAIVGRPNVGKSTLFNRILGWRKAIVDAQSGLTRDRLYGVAEWSGREFTIVDTAGLDMDSAKDESRAAIEGQTKVAIDQADVIVLLLDVREGLTAIDRPPFRARDPGARFRRTQPDFCSAWPGDRRFPGSGHRRAAGAVRRAGARFESRSARDHGPPQRWQVISSQCAARR